MWFARLCMGRWLLLVLSAATASRGQAEQSPLLDDLCARADAIELEYALTAEELDSLAGRRADVYAVSGETLHDVSLDGFARGEGDGRIVAATGRDAQEQEWAIDAGDLVRIDVDGRSYRPVFVASTDEYALEDATRRRQAVEQRLHTIDRRLWEERSADEQAALVEDYREQLIAAQQRFARLRLRIYETEYFLVLTDLPSTEVDMYVAQLDAMSERVGAAFGYPPGHNIWSGKAVVVAFTEQEHFVGFEHSVFDGTNADFGQGLCHRGEDGRVVVTCYQGDDPDYFASLLVHETAHGYIFRHLSDVCPPLWIDEGIAEWAAGATVAKTPARRQGMAAETLQRSGGFAGYFFNADVRLETWHYGAASSMVDILLKLGPRNFRLFFDGVKEGRPWEESLERAYGLTVEDLCRMYGRTIGVPDLAP